MGLVMVKRKGRGVGAEQRLVGERLVLDVAAPAQRPDADIEQEHAARGAEPVLIAQQGIAHDGKPEAGDDAENRVGGSGAETGNEAEAWALEQGAAHAQHAHGTDG